MNLQELLFWAEENLGSSEPFVHRWCVFLVARGLLSRNFPQVEFALQHFGSCPLCKKRLAEIIPLLIKEGLILK